MDIIIIVTTPKDQMESAAQEAKDAIENKVDWYFRKLATYPKELNSGDRVFYVENGFITGFGIVSGIANQKGLVCKTTDESWRDGIFVWMRCDSWQWIKPIPMKGFQGYRYRIGIGEINLSKVKNPCRFDFKIVGGWKDQKPKS